MNDESNEYHRMKRQIDALSQAAKRASEEQDYEKAGQLQNEILRLERELEQHVSQGANTDDQDKERLNTLFREAERASEEQDYEKAGQLQNEILRLERELEQHVSQGANTDDQDKERLNTLFREAERASEEQDYEEAPRLAEGAERKRLDAEIDFEIGRGNFVRAAMLAEQHQYPLEIVRDLQERALKRYAFVYHNPQGLHKLIQWYGFSESDVKRVLSEGSSGQ